MPGYGQPTLVQVGVSQCGLAVVPKLFYWRLFRGWLNGFAVQLAIYSWVDSTPASTVEEARATRAVSCHLLPAADSAGRGSAGPASITLHDSVGADVGAGCLPNDVDFTRLVAVAHSACICL
jgi:hypothetical protein